MSGEGAPVWRNHTGNQSCRPRAIERPGTLEALVELVRRAEREGTTVRAVGAGHSWSDVALTDGFLADPSEMSGLVELDDGCMKDGTASGPLVRVLGGTHIHQLNDALDAQGLGLSNMGGYDAQTIAGVVSTSTHGSGIAFGAFPDTVRSLDLVVAGGEVIRVEPADGLTDDDAFERKHGASRRLVQDDGTFAAAVCGMGCVGLVHSLVLSVRERFWLNEIRRLSTWEAVKDELAEDGLLGSSEHYELFLNPYASRGGEHRLLVTTRDSCPDPGGLPEDKQRRHPLTELAALHVGPIFRLLARHWPRLLPLGFNHVLKGMEDDGYASVSYKVFNIGMANKLPAYSAELAVPLEQNRHVEAVDRIIRHAASRKGDGVVHTSPIALRFVAPSPAYASMMHGRATMMIELIMVYPTKKGDELLTEHEHNLADLAVRPHWGQFNALGTATDFPAMYPRWGDWLSVYEDFNASGVFNSPFTERIGISRP